MKWLSALFALLLVGCSGTQIAAEPQVVTQIVERTVLVRETVIVTATPLPATATPKATPTPAEPTPLPVGGKWELEQDHSEFDDSTQVFLFLAAESEVSGSFERYRPTLVLRCSEGKLDSYIIVGMIVDVEGSDDTATVRLRFDKNEAQTVKAHKSTDSKALFLVPAKSFIDQMLAADEMVFQFTPFSASPATTSFDLRGLGEVIDPLFEACPNS